MKTKLLLLLLLIPLYSLPAQSAVLYEVDFSKGMLGKIPAGWTDLGLKRSAPNWGVDGEGGMRVLWKGERGLLVYEGALADGRSGEEFSDGMITAEFAKTPDEEVSFGLVGRVRDAKNFYAVRLSGQTRIELIKVVDGQEEKLADWVTRSRYREGEKWKMTLAFSGGRITGKVFNQEGLEEARVDALDKEGFPAGAAGLQATNFAAAKSFRLEALKPFTAKWSGAEIERRNQEAGADDPAVLRPVKGVEELNTPFEKLADAYDVIVAGAGTGGWAAAVQAARLGSRVLLLEETDWIGGQMAAAAVATMDEEGLWGKVPVRERGLYREFHQSIVNYYYTKDKDPFRAYYAWPEQLEGGFEPKAVRQVLYAFIKDARDRKAVLDLATGSKVVSVLKSGEKVEGVEVEHGGKKKTVRCKVLVEATEYGDMLPLAGARYRVGSTTSDNLDPKSLVQYHTWVGVIREYPEGVPDHLRIKTPPPGYDSKRYRGSQLYGPVIWGSAGKDVKGPRSYRVLFAWRGMADGDSSATGKATEQRHTQCGLNGGRQDYPVTAGSIEDLAARREGERDGIYRTLGEIYYFQNELGLPWAVAEDEGYDTPHNRETMKALQLREDLLPIAVHLPQWPYVREARRARGIYTLRAADLQRFAKAKLFPTSVAMGDYFMDLDHGPTGHAVEQDLDTGEPPRGGGPFQVPFEVFIPEKVDGLVLAEKNLSQSRLVNGATRLQPITILTGQAAGTIAALAAREGVQPRKVNPVAVQTVLLESGSNLIQRWYEDVVWGTPLWRATQLLSLYGVMDAPGAINSKENQPMGGGNFWKAEDTLSPQDFVTAAARLAALAGKTAPPAANDPTWNGVNKVFTAIDPNWKPRAGSGGTLRRGEFALAAAELLRTTGKPKLLADGN